MIDDVAVSAHVSGESTCSPLFFVHQHGEDGGIAGV